MAKYYVTRSFVYRNRHGRQTFVGPEFKLFDTDDPAREIDSATFVPPLVCLVAGDAEAQAALAAIRTGYDPDTVYAGIGKLPENIIYIP
jgi:hypothetical protein